MYINWERVGIVAFFVGIAAAVCLANFILDPADFKGTETIGLKCLHFAAGVFLTGIVSLLCLLIIAAAGSGLWEMFKWVTTPDPPDPPDSSEETPPPMPPVQNAAPPEPKEPEEPEMDRQDIPRTFLMDFS